MSSDKLTKEIAYKALEDFFKNRPFVFLGTGTSCAVDLDFGMPSLQCHILTCDEDAWGLTKEQMLQWDMFRQDIADGVLLEPAMNRFHDVRLVDQLVKITREHVISVQRKWMKDMVSGKKRCTVQQILKRIYDTLSPLDPVLHIATSNYDLLIEMTLQQQGISFTTGFVGSVIRSLDWIHAERQFCCRTRKLKGRKTEFVNVTSKHVRLYKVHGSLNWYRIGTQIVETDLPPECLPDDAEPLMVTPGVTKHERLLCNRDKLLQEYDANMKKHAAFLFLGFGFNDPQLLGDGLESKLTSQDCMTLIITRDNSDTIIDRLSKNRNAWLVCKSEVPGYASEIHNTQFAEPLLLTDVSLWQFDVFASTIMGG